MTSESPTPPTSNMPPQPDPALSRLQPLVGTWVMIGRTLGSEAYDVNGKVTITWMPGGHFLTQQGEMTVQGTAFHSLEVVGYDPATDVFSSIVFSSMDGVPADYFWDVQGDVVTHWTAGSKYTGKFSADRRTLIGGWSPDAGVEATPANTYEVTMRRIK